MRFQISFSSPCFAAWSTRQSVIFLIFKEVLESRKQQNLLKRHVEIAITRKRVYNVQFLFTLLFV